MGWIYPRMRGLSLLLLLAAFASFFSVPAAAAPGQPFAPGSICYASAKAEETFTAVREQPRRWQCDMSTPRRLAERWFVRHDLRALPAGAAMPRFVEFDRYPFEKVTVEAVEGDGTARGVTYGFFDAGVGRSSMRAILPLPEVVENARAVVFTLDGGDFPETLVNADLVTEPSVRITAGLPHLIAALLCGLLIAPLLFDFGYWRALKEPFPLFHGLFCIMAFVQTAAVSGLIPLMTPATYRLEMDITYLSLDGMIAATYLFAYTFVEKRALGPWQRRILAALTVMTLANGFVTTFWAAEIGRYVDHIYFGLFVGGLVIYFLILSSAWRAGSRAAPYLAMGLAPMAAVQAAQCLSVFVSNDFAFDETWPQNLTLLFEVVATALAVADRFMAVRRQRDKARDEARILGALSEHDDLTGLLNRRALDAQFPKLVADGFTTLAIIDIDHFKAINDIHGHPTGDVVLTSAAGALKCGDDEDLHAYRIGGEEFLLLLRGARAGERAEQRRRAISLRVAGEVESLDRPVTASMGIIDFAELAKEGLADFSALYSRADCLLYEAKRQGRNRAQSDKLALFDPEAEGWSDSAVSAA